jgi:hypothetical protein
MCLHAHTHTQAINIKKKWKWIAIQSFIEIDKAHWKSQLDSHSMAVGVNIIKEWIVFNLI